MINCGDQNPTFYREFSNKSIRLRLHLQKISNLLPTSDTDRNLMQACKHKNPHEMRFRIRSELFPNVVLNPIHIRYLDIRPTSKHTYRFPTELPWGDTFAHKDL